MLHPVWIKSSAAFHRFTNNHHSSVSELASTEIRFVCFLLESSWRLLLYTVCCGCIAFVFIVIVLFCNCRFVHPVNTFFSVNTW